MEITMNVQQAIKERRSIRSYTGEAVSDEQLKTILEAGFYAPTARNLCPTHFIVIRDKEKLCRIAEEQPNARYAPEAGCAVLVCGDKEKDVDGYLAENASAAIQNMLLSAHEMGLGTVWCGVYPRDGRVASCREICGIPESILPVGLVIIGYPNEEKPVPERYNESFVHNEQW